MSLRLSLRLRHPALDWQVPAVWLGSLLSAGRAPSTPQSKKRTHVPRRRGAAVARREVRDRDGVQCTFVDESGQRCRETRFLELHHELAHALGGGETAPNLAIRCQAHNALAAEQDFGREFIAERITEARRERPMPGLPPP